MPLSVVQFTNFTGEQEVVRRSTSPHLNMLPTPWTSQKSLPRYREPQKSILARILGLENIFLPPYNSPCGQRLWVKGYAVANTRSAQMWQLEITAILTTDRVLATA